MNAGSLASIYLAGESWLLPALGAFAVFALMVVLGYRKSPARPGIRATCATLKLMGAALLLACLLEPMWSGQRAKPGANLIAVVADNSRSMGVRDHNSSESRGATLVRSLGDAASGWRAQLARDFEVRNYLADSRLLPTRDFHELAFDAESTLPAKTFAALQERHRGQPLAGLLYLTDGVMPDLDPAVLTGLPPVYPVIFASEAPERDIAMGAATVTQTSFEDAPVTLQVEATAAGFSGKELVARLYQIEDTANPAAAKKGAVLEQTVVVPATSDKVVVRMQVRPARLGVLFYRLQITPKDPALTEALTVNNETMIAVDRGAIQNRVLYVGGRPNWDFKFLNRAVMADEQTQLVALIRIAKREPKFEFRGRAGESSNPLFRGFGNQSKEEVERYDQPVLVRLGTEDETELRGGFPKRAEDLFKYRAVILDDVEAEFFTSEQMVLLEKFVSERGGGLLMMAGAESFAEGNYERTKVAEMLPVYVQGKAKLGATIANDWKLSLSREGWIEPWVRLRSAESDEKARLEELPSFSVVNQTGEAKPGATIVARVSDGTREVPALAAQRFGRGRTAAMLIGDFFQSGLGNEARQNDLGRAWRQLVRWIIADVPDRIEVRTEETGDGMKIRVWARNEKFEPMDHARVTLAIGSTHGGAPPVLIPAEVSATEAGMFEAMYHPRVSGGYRVEATVEAEDGKVAGVAQTGWTTNLATAEYRDLKPNIAAMEMLAKRTGGRVLKPAELDSFVRDLPSERVPITETWTQPLWHTPWVMLAALVCFLMEWGLRRRHGLA
jgi:uncharacterized membrane protein